MAVTANASPCGRGRARARTGSNTEAASTSLPSWRSSDALEALALEHLDHLGEQDRRVGRQRQVDVPEVAGAERVVEAAGGAALVVVRRAHLRVVQPTWQRSVERVPLLARRHLHHRELAQLVRRVEAVLDRLRLVHEHAHRRRQSLKDVLVIAIHAVVTGCSRSLGQGSPERRSKVGRPRRVGEGGNSGTRPSLIFYLLAVHPQTVVTITILALPLETPYAYDWEPTRRGVRVEGVEVLHLRVSSHWVQRRRPLVLSNLGVVAELHVLRRARELVVAPVGLLQRHDADVEGARSNHPVALPSPPVVPGERSVDARFSIHLFDGCTAEHGAASSVHKERV
eukprot:scaffold42691_cov68-Phaeocystis_antarctica.AAC.2